MLPESESRRELQRQNLAAAGLHSRAAWINLNAVRFVLAFLTLVVGGFWLLMAPPQLETISAGFCRFRSTDDVGVATTFDQSPKPANEELILDVVCRTCLIC